MKIENIELDIIKHYLNPVTYVPNHAKGNAGHIDCEQGVIISFKTNTNPYKHDTVKVLYCKSRTIQSTEPNNLVWG